jgi:hypothetical protein
VATSKKAEARAPVPVVDVAGARLAAREADQADARDLATNPERADERRTVRAALARMGITGDVFRTPKAKPPKPAKTKQMTMLPAFKGPTVLARFRK